MVRLIRVDSIGGEVVMEDRGDYIPSSQPTISESVKSKKKGKGERTPPPTRDASPLDLNTVGDFAEEFNFDPD